MKVTLTLFLCVLVCGLVHGRTVMHNVNTQYTVPVYPTDPFKNATYACLFIDLAAVRSEGNLWLTRIQNNVDETMVHHTIAYTVHEDSFLIGPGGPLEGIQDGYTIDDCSIIQTDAQYRPHILSVHQAGSRTIDLLAQFDDDNSTANGYSYGIPVGAQTPHRFVALEMHVHNDAHEHGLTTTMSFQFKMTDDAPVKEVGWTIGGVLTPVPGLPKNIFMDIPINSDGEYRIESTSQPEAPFCNPYLYPDAVECETCCPNSPLVHFDNAGALRMEQYGIQEIEAIATLMHAHHLQKELRTWIKHLNGTETLLDECLYCGSLAHSDAQMAGMDPMMMRDPNALHILPSPVKISNTDGQRTECVYKRHMGMTDNVVGGYRSDEEMCGAFIMYAYKPVSTRLAPTIPFYGYCSIIQNKGYPNQNDPLGFYRSYLCYPPCGPDPGCVQIPSSSP